MPLAPVLRRLRDNENLSAAETRDIFDAIFDGEIPEERIAAFLLALRRKGETKDEILGAARSMRARMNAISAPGNAIDIVGTGGDGRNTPNISTAAALVVAACGVPVAKHGNRAATGKSGSSDVLAALGVNLEPDFGILERCLAEANLCFLFAPRHHPAMRHVAEMRRKLGVRTIFNLLGPLTNPANVKRHVIGVYAKEWLGPMAEVLDELGSEAAWLTHGRDGMDEISTLGASDIVALDKDKITAFSVSPEDAGIARPAPESLQGGDAACNADMLRELLAGEKNAYRDITAINAAAALIVAAKARDLKQGVALAEQALDSGAAREILRKLTDITNRKPS